MENKVAATPKLQIYETRDYGAFKIMAGNRPINRVHVDRLKTSMKTKAFVSPVKVNSKMEILDGQHSYTARKELGLPINYYVENDISISDVANMNNTTKKWAHDDYAGSFSKAGNENYTLYQNYRKEFPQFAHGVVLAILANKTFRGIIAEKEFRDGKLHVADYSKAVIVGNNITRIGKYYDGYNKRAFIYAMLKVFRHPDFNMDTFLHKVSKKSDLLKDYSQINNYLEAIEKIYNWNNSKRIRLY